MQKNYWRTYIPGRESRRGFISRIKALGRRVDLFSGTEDAILFVTHARLINAFITYMIGEDLNQRWVYSPRSASISVLERKPAAQNFSLINFCLLYTSRCFNAGEIERHISGLQGRRCSGWQRGQGLPGLGGADKRCNRLSGSGGFNSFGAE